MLGLAGFFSVAAALLGIAAFAAGLWLVVIAFKRSTMWGVLSLFVPFAVIVFAVKFWQDSRKPFLISMATGIGSVVLFLGTAVLAASSVTQELTAQVAADPAFQELIARHGPTAPNPKPSGDGAVPTPDPDPTSAEPAALRALTFPPGGFRSVAPREKPIYDPAAVTRDGYAPVALRDAAKLAGRHVKVVTANGRVHRGDLLRANADGITIQRWLVGGSMAITFRSSEIDTLHVDVD